MIILDTNIISELFRQQPAFEVMAWLEAQPAQALVTTSITLAELRFGVHSMPSGKRKEHLVNAITEMLESHLLEAILPFDQGAAEIYGMLAADLRNRGIEVGQSDKMIAAITLFHDVTLVTRNEKDFLPCHVNVFNPFNA